MSNDRDPVVSLRLDEARRDGLDELAELTGWDRSRLMRAGIDQVLETHRDLLEDLREVDELLAERDQIAEEGKDVEKILGFPGRVESHFEDRFKEEWSPAKLLDSARSYYREAEKLEEAAEKHPDVESVDEGDFVDAVDRQLENALEAMQLTNWGDRHANPYERFDGVEEGKNAREFALILTRNAMGMDEDLEPLRSSLATERRVQGDDLPPLAEEDLPADLEREDVADAARRLIDGGVSPDDVATDPTEFDPFGWTEETPAVDADHSAEPEGEDEDVEEVSVDAPSLEPDAAGAPAVEADGGDHVAVQAFDDDRDDLEDVTVQGDGEPDDDRDDDREDARPARSVNDLVEWAADELRGTETDKASRKRAEDRIRAALESDTDNWRDELMADTDLTPTDLIDLADEYNDTRAEAFGGDRPAPEAVRDDSGGVRVE